MASVQVTYKPAYARGFERKINKADFSKNNIEQDAVRFNEANNFTTDMSREAFDFLKAHGEPVSIDEAPAEATTDPTDKDPNPNPQDAANATPEAKKKTR